MEKKQPLFVVRPKFSSFLAMVEAFAVTLVSSTAITLVGGTVLMIVISMTGLSRFIPGSFIYTLLFIGSLIALPIFYYKTKRNAYQHTSYKFYADYVEFHRFKYLLNLRVGRINYSDITNVMEYANVLQQREKVATLYLFVPSAQILQSGRFTGLKMTDVPQAGDWQQKILTLIDQSQEQPPMPVAQAG